MLFFKADGKWINKCGDSDKISPDDAEKFGIETHCYNSQNGGNACIFLTEIVKNRVTVTAIEKEKTDMAYEIQKYCGALGLSIDFSEVREITYQSFRGLLRTAEINLFLESAEAVLEQFGLKDLRIRGGNGFSVGENLIPDLQATTNSGTPADFPISAELASELERIHAGRNPDLPTTPGHPVHYLLLTDNTELRRECSRTLLGALYQNGRLQCRRYAFVDVRPSDSFSEVEYDALYRSCAGGAIVIRYHPKRSEDPLVSAIVAEDHDWIDTVCTFISRYRHEVLSILCLPVKEESAKKVKDSFLNALESLSLVEINESLIRDDDARAYLAECAKKRGVHTDASLLEKIEHGRGYDSSDLNLIFDKWYDLYLKKSVYPQYHEIRPVQKELADRLPCGSAYERLRDMVGIHEAKETIQKITAFHKLQTFYRNRHSAGKGLHMAFYGNPGTAKTSVARLFSEIMKDNGILTDGHLVEVGRCDLVGKYVGWTAKTVKEKFREARGGVLLIDEAYALVDQARGSYGDEAINTIVSEMENHREETAVIFTGYPDEMKTFLERNPGLLSRITFHIPFPDYSVEELCEIALRMAKQDGLLLSAEAQEKLWSICKEARQRRDFGNGRFVRNLLWTAQMNLANRIFLQDSSVNINASDPLLLLPEDLETASAPPENNKAMPRIGFCA